MKFYKSKNYLFKITIVNIILMHMKDANMAHLLTCIHLLILTVTGHTGAYPEIG